MKSPFTGSSELPALDLNRTNSLKLSCKVLEALVVIHSRIA